MVRNNSFSEQKEPFDTCDPQNFCFLFGKKVGMSQILFFGGKKISQKKRNKGGKEQNSLGSGI